eukprot:796245_1
MSVDHRRCSRMDPKGVGVHSVARCHALACVSLARSPHFDDVCLTVGDWSFAIWKKDMLTPLFHSPFASAYLTCACWSPTRPAVVVTAKTDGTVDVWDLLDQSHAPVLQNWPVASCCISSMQFWQSTTRSTQYLAAGDTGGNLHILEIPRSFRRHLHSEISLVRSFYDREIARVDYVAGREKVLAVERAELEKQEQSKQKEAPKDDAAAAAATPKEGAEEERDEGVTAEEQKAEDAFQKMLRKFRRELCEDDGTCA